MSDAVGAAEAHGSRAPRGTVRLPCIVCRRFTDEKAGLIAATTFLADLNAFGDEPTRDVIGMLSGQIARRHYVFGVENGRPVAYAGWGLCSPDVAGAYLAGSSQPTHAECLSGSTVLIFVVAAANAAAALRVMRHLREHYSGHRYAAKRIRSGSLESISGRL